MFMEFRDLVAVLRRSLAWILLFGALGAVLSFGMGVKAAQSPRAAVVASLSFQTVQEPAGAVALDGYYVIETERRYGELLGQLLRNTEQQEAFARASGAHVGRIERLSHADFRVELSGRAVFAPEAKQAFEDILGKALAEAVDRSGEPLSARLEVSDAVPVFTISRAPLAFIGAFLGLFVGVFVVLLRHYFRSGERA